jgi:hypothetical protein
MAIFPNGVCDWSKPGIAQQRPIGTWISYLPCPDKTGKEDSTSISIGGVTQCSLAGDGDRDDD